MSGRAGLWAVDGGGVTTRPATGHLRLVKRDGPSTCMPATARFEVSMPTPDDSTDVPGVVPWDFGSVVRAVHAGDLDPDDAIVALVIDKANPDPGPP